MPPAPASGSSASLALDQGLLKRLTHYLITRCDPPQLVTCGSAEEMRDGSIAEAPTSDRRLVVINLDVLQLLDACWELADPLLTSNTLGTLEVLKAEVMNLFHGSNGGSDPERRSGGTPNVEVSLRLTHMPPTMPPGTCGSSLKQSCGCLVSLTGTMIRVTGKRVVPSSSTYRCGKCGQNRGIASDPFHRGDMRKPRCEEKSCKGEVLQLITQTWMDYAECRLQQRLEATGRMPRSILVALDDELTTKCTVGQLVEVVGVVRERWKNVYANAVPTIELVVWALNITPMDASQHATARDRDGADSVGTCFRPELVATEYKLSTSGFAAEAKLRAHLLASTCPQLSGVFGPRLGVLLAAVDGAVRSATSGNMQPSSALRVRSTIHMLLVGDPSTLV
jgi:DNA replicative helicase MCM subunit Mcm2 (Cdc46/Mcm family)